MIYTGYYSKFKAYNKAGLKTISISRTRPNGIMVYANIPELYPDEHLLWDYKKGKVSNEEYTSRYIEQLDKLGIREILLKIHSYGDDVILLCWESPDKFCHRHILADYINTKTKLNIKEYKDE